MKIGVIVAMDKEFVQLKSLLENSQMEQDNHLSFVKGKIKQNEIVLMQCGIGKVNAAIGAVEMIHRYQPQLIVSSGCAGAADTALNPKDVVVSTECCYHDAYCGKECAKGQIMGMPASYVSPPGISQQSVVSILSQKHQKRTHCKRRLVCGQSGKDATHPSIISQSGSRGYGKWCDCANLSPISHSFYLISNH